MKITNKVFQIERHLYWVLSTNEILAICLPEKLKFQYPPHLVKSNHPNWYVLIERFSRQIEGHPKKDSEFEVKELPLHNLLTVDDPRVRALAKKELQKLKR